MSHESGALPTLPELRTIRGILDESGAIGVVEGCSPVPFEIRRIYYLHGIAYRALRGSHAHRRLQQFIIPIAGSFDISLTDGVREWHFHLNNAHQGLYVPSGFWRTLSNFSGGAVCLVLASHEYDEDDYIRDFTTFLEWKMNP